MKLVHAGHDLLLRGALAFVEVFLEVEGELLEAACRFALLGDLPVEEPEGLGDLEKQSMVVLLLFLEARQARLG